MFKSLLAYLFPHHHRSVHQTVRYAFPFIAVTALAAGLASVLSGQSSYLTLTASPSDVAEGDTFYVTVEVTAHTAVNAVDIVINYPETRMRVDNVDTGTSVITLWTEQPYAKDGRVYIRGGTFQRGFIGTHTVARIRATALTSGMAHLTTDSATFIAGDGKGTEVKVSNIGESGVRLAILTDNGSIVGEASISIVTDIDGDGKVDLKDISVFMASWFSKRSVFDFDGDGRMTFRDFSILLYDSFTK